MTEKLIKLVKSFGASSTEIADDIKTVAKEPDEPEEEYGDLSKLLGFAKQDKRTSLQREGSTNEFTGKRFIVDAIVHDILGAIDTIFVYAGVKTDKIDYVFQFDNEWGCAIIFNEPPDFEINGSVGVEVTRITQRYADGKQDNEDSVSSTLSKTCTRILEEFNPAATGPLWQVDIECDFSSVVLSPENAERFNTS